MRCCVWVCAAVRERDLATLQRPNLQVLQAVVQSIDTQHKVSPGHSSDNSTIGPVSADALRLYRLHPCTLTAAFAWLSQASTSIHCFGLGGTRAFQTCQCCTCY